MVDIAIAIARIPILTILSEIFGYILAKLLAAPLADAIFPGVPTDALSAVADAMSPRSARARSAMASTTRTTTVVEEDVPVFLEFGALAAGAIDGSGGGILRVTPCSAAYAERECNGLAVPTSATRCSWCTQTSGGSTVGVCVVCEERTVSDLARDGYTCSRDATVCAAPSPSPSPSQAPSKAPAGRKTDTPEGQGVPADLPVVPPPPEPTVPPNEAAANLVKTITTTAGEPLLHLLHNAMVPLLRRRLTDKLVRGIVRDAAVNVTADVVGELAAELGAPVLATTATTLTKSVIDALTRGLVPALVPAIAASLSRSPVVDHICALCSSQQLYCDACTAAQAEAATASDAAWYAGEAAGEAAAATLRGPLADMLAAVALDAEAAAIRAVAAATAAAADGERN